MIDICGLVLHLDRLTVVALLVWCGLLELRDRHVRGNGRAHDGDGDDDVLQHLAQSTMDSTTPQLRIIGRLPACALPGATPATSSSFFTPPACKGLESAPAA